MFNLFMLTVENVICLCLQNLTLSNCINGGQMQVKVIIDNLYHHITDNFKVPLTVTGYKLLKSLPCHLN